MWFLLGYGVHPERKHCTCAPSSMLPLTAAPSCLRPTAAGVLHQLQRLPQQLLGQRCGAATAPAGSERSLEAARRAAAAAVAARDAAAAAATAAPVPPPPGGGAATTAGWAGSPGMVGAGAGAVGTGLPPPGPSAAAAGGGRGRASSGSGDRGRGGSKGSGGNEQPLAVVPVVLPISAAGSVKGNSSGRAAGIVQQQGSRCSSGGGAGVGGEAQDVVAGGLPLGHVAVAIIEKAAASAEDVAGAGTCTYTGDTPAMFITAGSGSAGEGRATPVFGSSVEALCSSAAACDGDAPRDGVLPAAADMPSTKLCTGSWSLPPK
jgi:hypothetical protein